MSALTQRSIFWFGRIASSCPGRAVFDRTARKAESRPAVAPPSTRAAPSPGRALTGRAPCYDAERPCRSSAWSGSASHFLAAAGVTRMGRDAEGGSVARPFWTRDSTRPEPAGRGCRPIVEAKPRAPTVDASSKRRTLGIPASPGADRQSGRFDFGGRHELSAVTSSPWSEAWSRICRARLTIKTTETASFQPPGR